MAKTEAQYYLTLSEVTLSFGVEAGMIVEIVEQGIISVEKDRPEDWKFDHEALACIRRVLQLHKDLGVNVAGAALAIDLLKEIDRLEHLLR